MYYSVFKLQEKAHHGQTVITYNQTSNNNFQASNNNSRIIQEEHNKRELTLNNSSINAQNVHIGDNVVNVTNNNIPSQRHITNTDINKLRNIPLIASVSILYPEGSREAKNFAEEVFNKLFDLGYHDISKGTISGSEKFSHGKFTIQQDGFQKNNFSIIINPQL